VFGRNVNGSVDTFPIIIQRPKGSGNMQRWFYNGKYSCHVVKVRSDKKRSNRFLSIDSHIIDVYR
jgi:hypothetical protein